MKTITFYSYKGGVGRSLALSNMATRLSEFNKKVCVLDFDLEAPGLHLKFNGYHRLTPISKGLVDYIHSFSCEGKLPPKISNYSVELLPHNSIFKPIQFIPAGDIENPSYWKKLSMIKWSEMFFEEGGQGVSFFFDLKAKIQNEFNPDFLLIDSRTGITEMAGVTLRVLADDVVILAANNAENIWGSKKIIKSLLDNIPLSEERIPKIHFVLTRLPFDDSPKERGKEQQLLEARKKEFQAYLNLPDFDISIIHSERKLEESESLLMGYAKEEKKVSISNDYLDLFNRITIGSLSEAEIILFERKKIAEHEYEKAIREHDITKKLLHISKAIDLDENNFIYYWDRGFYLSKSNKLEESLIDLKKAAELNPNNSNLLFGIAVVLFELKKFEEALQFLDKSLELDNLNAPTYNLKSLIFRSLNRIQEALDVINLGIEIVELEKDILLNGRADLYRILGDFPKAYSDIYKAIEINSSEPMYFATLAEISGMDGKLEEFYLNLNIALSKELTIDMLSDAIDVYKNFKNEERFINLMNKYNLSIEDLFKER